MIHVHVCNNKLCSVLAVLVMITLNFMITAEILVRSLANFYCQLADRHMKL